MSADQIVHSLALRTCGYSLARRACICSLALPVVLPGLGCLAAIFPNCGLQAIDRCQNLATRILFSLGIRAC